MTSAQSVSSEVLKCPFCGKDDIEYGLALCASCHAEVTYDTDVKKIAKYPPDFQERFDATMKELNALNEEAMSAGWFKARSIHKRTGAMLSSIERDMAVEDEKLLQTIIEYKMNPARSREVTFTRGEKSIEVSVGPTP